MEQLMNAFVLALISMSNSAQPSRPMTQIEDWPPLAITEHLVTTLPMACKPDGTGCAVVRLADRTCDVYIAWREPQKAAMRERQLKHCRGYDEPPFRLKEAHAQWLAAGKPVRARKGDASALMAATD